MIEKIDFKLKKLLDEIPFIHCEVRSAYRFKIADGTLSDGRVYPVVFVDQQDITHAGLNNPTWSHSTDIVSLQRFTLSRSSLSVSKLVDIQKNITALPLNLQSKVEAMDGVRWTDTVYFNALTVSGETHQCVVNTTDPYYCVNLPENEPSANIVDVTPLSIDNLDDSIRSTQVRPSFCIYVS